MSLPRLVSLFVLIAFAKSATAQETAIATPPQASVLLQQSLAALTGGHPLTDVTLSGTARRIAGSDDESGTAVLKAVAAGASSVSLSLPSGARSEIQNCSTTPPAGTWSGPDGVPHPISSYNLQTAPAWFFPVFPIASGFSAGYTATYVGLEMRAGMEVSHVAVSQVPTFPTPQGVVSLAHLSQLDFFLDTNSALPVALVFNAHPDGNPSIDIEIEIRFSDYRTVSGVQVPFHVQQLINNNLALDLQFDSAVLNSGISASSFSL